MHSLPKHLQLDHNTEDENINTIQYKKQIYQIKVFKRKQLTIRQNSTKIHVNLKVMGEHQT